MINIVIKKTLLFLIIIFIGTMLYFCIQSAVASDPSSSSTITPVAGYRGIKLGDSPSAVNSVIGAPNSIYETTWWPICLVYYYGPFETKSYYYFTKSDNKLIAVFASAKDASESLNGIIAGSTTSEVQAIMGTYQNLLCGKSYYDWDYPFCNVWVRFSYSTNTVASFGIYDPSMMTFNPD